MGISEERNGEFWRRWKREGSCRGRDERVIIIAVGATTRHCEIYASETIR